MNVRKKIITGYILLCLYDGAVGNVGIGAAEIIGLLLCIVCLLVEIRKQSRYSPPLRFH